MVTKIFERTWKNITFRGGNSQILVQWYCDWTRFIILSKLSTVCVYVYNFFSLSTELLRAPAICLNILHIWSFSVTEMPILYSMNNPHKLFLHLQVILIKWCISFSGCLWFHCWNYIHIILMEAIDWIPSLFIFWPLWMIFFDKTCIWHYLSTKVHILLMSILH